MTKRDHEVKIYLTEDEKHKIRKKAQQKGQQLSSYGRAKLLESLEASQ